jgi:hypothetical protein
MGSLLKMINLLMLIMMVSACATTNTIIPEKYLLDKQLERVQEIQDFRMGRGRAPAFIIIDYSGPESRYRMVDQSDSEGPGPGRDLRGTINQINTVTLSESSHDWIKVDNQSLIIRTGPSEYHLLVLQIVTPYLMFSEDISFTSSNNVIRAGVDLVQLGNNMNYLIDRIYKINSNEQMYVIKKQLMDENIE